MTDLTITGITNLKEQVKHRTILLRKLTEIQKITDKTTADWTMQIKSHLILNQIKKMIREISMEIQMQTKTETLIHLMINRDPIIL